MINSILAYLLKDPKTKSLILFSQNMQTLNLFNHKKRDCIKDVEKESQTQLKYVFLNQNSKIKQNLINVGKQISIVTPQTQGDLRPLVIGDLTICFVDSKGYKNPFSLIAVTHLTQNSTKFPILFPGTLISPCSINYKSFQGKSNQYLNSLQKLKYFPNQSYIFPATTVSEEDLLFAKALTKNPVIDEKIKIFERNKQFGDALIPTTVLEQKMMNPFLTCNQYKQILGTSDKQKSFNLLRKMRQQFKVSL